MLEESLREMFAARVEYAPSTHEVAARAIRRGRAIRRRRTVASSLAAATALVLTIGAVGSFGGWWQVEERGRPGTAAGLDPLPEGTATSEAAPTPTPGPENGIGLDLRVGDLLWTSDGRQLRLTGVGEVLRSYRVPDGWVYGGAANVRLMRPDGTSVSLSGEEDRWVVSPDGGRIAFVVGTALYVADLRATGLAVRASRNVPPAATPVAFVGDRVAVSAGSLGFDVLDPAKADPPAWNPDVVAIYGSQQDTAIGLVRLPGQPGFCVAQLTRTGAGLRPEATGACDLGLDTAGSPPRLAPDGAWLAAADAGRINLVDLTRALRGHRAVVSCQVRSRATPAWADAGTLVTDDGSDVVRCHTDGSRQTVALPEGVTAGWELVPKLTTPDLGRP